MRTIFLAVFVLLPVQAQDNPARVTKLIEVKYADINKIRNLIGVFASKNTRVEIDASEGTHYVALAGAAEDVEVVERFIKKVDVPHPADKNIELTVYMLLGQHADAGEKLPAEFAGVTKQLQATFGIKEFRLIETFTGRVRDGKWIESSGLLSLPPLGATGPPATYNLKIQRCSLREDGKTRTIRLDNLRFGARVPYASVTGKDQWQFLDTGITTDIDVREGQKVVVGKTSIVRADSLFIVVMAKVVE